MNLLSANAMAGSNMKKLCILILAVTLLASSCGQASRTTDLRQMLSEIPFELGSGDILWFSNMERIKELAGVDPDIDVSEYVNRETEVEVYRERMDILAGYTMSDFSGGTHLQRWQDAFGFDAFDTNHEIWISQVEPKGTRPLFSVMKGSFDKNEIIEKLNNLGYQLKEYASTDYYSINEDYQLGDIRSSQTAGMAMSYLNRMMVTEGDIIAAPADDIFFSVLDVRSGQQSSLEDSLAYTRVAEALGDVLGAALVPQSVLRSENVSEDWDNLHTYDLAGIGYQVEGQDRKVVIALHYADKSAADDINELNRRLAEYVIRTGSLETPLLSDLFDVDDPEVTVYGPDSILKVGLVYKPDTPRTLWSDMVELRDLGFLVSDPSK
jgi:hypothetical protein